MPPMAAMDFKTSLAERFAREGVPVQMQSVAITPLGDRWRYRLTFVAGSLLAVDESAVLGALADVEIWIEALAVQICGAPHAH